MAAPWPGRGSAPGNGAHLGSPRVLHDLVVVIGHVAHRRVRRVRRVRGGVWPRGFRGKFLTDCVTVRWKPDAEKRNQGSDEKMLGRACSTFLPHCLFIRDRSRLFVHQKNLILDSNAKLTIPPRHYWHLTTKKCFLRRKANCLSGRPTFGLTANHGHKSPMKGPPDWRKGIRVRDNEPTILPNRTIFQCEEGRGRHRAPRIALSVSSVLAVSDMVR